MVATAWTVHVVSVSEQGISEPKNKWDSKVGVSEQRVRMKMSFPDDRPLKAARRLISKTVISIIQSKEQPIRISEHFAVFFDGQDLASVKHTRIDLVMRLLRLPCRSIRTINQ